MKNYAINFLIKLNDSVRFVPEFRKEFGMPLWDNELFFDYEKSKVLIFPLKKEENRELSALLYFVFGRDEFSFNTLSRGETYEKFGDTKPLFYWVEYNVYGQAVSRDVKVELPVRNEMLKNWIEITNCWYYYYSTDFGQTWTYSYSYCTVDYHWTGGSGSYGGGVPFDVELADWGEFGGGSGGSTNPPVQDQVIEPSDTLPIIAKSLVNFSFSDIEKLNSVLQEFLQDCYNRQILNYFITNGIKFDFVINNSLGGWASYNHTDKRISFQNRNRIDLRNIREEMFQAYQHFNLGFSNTQRLSNFEFEAKLYGSIFDYLQTLCCPLFSDNCEPFNNEIQNWIEDLILRNVNWTSQDDEKYSYFLQLWHENRPVSYASYSLNYGLMTPDRLLNLVNPTHGVCPLIHFDY